MSSRLAANPREGMSLLMRYRFQARNLASCSGASFATAFSMSSTVVMAGPYYNPQIERKRVEHHFRPKPKLSPMP
jgi:hypothetical protein